MPMHGQRQEGTKTCPHIASISETEDPPRALPPSFATMASCDITGHALQRRDFGIGMPSKRAHPSPISISKAGRR